MTFQVADILYLEDTDEYLLLVERKLREQEDGRYDNTWDMMDILSGNRYWEWEFVLEGSGQYERIA